MVPRPGWERWLESVPAELRGTLRESMHPHHFSAGEFAVREGEPGDALWVVESGHLAVQATAYDGSIATLNVLGPGEVFGELALLTGAGRRTASVVALDEVTALALNARDFATLRDRHPSMDRFLVDVLASHVMRLTQLVDDAYTRDADQRVLRRLLALAGGATAPVVVPIDQSTLAALAGASRQTANRVLRAAADAGWLVLRRRRIEIVDPEALRDHASD